MLKILAWVSLIDIVPKVVDALLEKGEGQKEERKDEKNFLGL